MSIQLNFIFVIYSPWRTAEAISSFTDEATVKAIPNDKSDELHKERIDNHAESEDVAQGLSDHLINSAPFTETVTVFVKQQTKQPSIGKWSADKW